MSDAPMAGIVISPIPRESCHERDARSRISAAPAPLSGISLAVKDNIDVAGVPTTEGSGWAASEAGIPAVSAPVVAALSAAGAQPSVKVNLHEFAYGVTSANPWFGAVPNPVLPDRIAGGSSGGSAAAVAAGIAELALGTDTSGSIRIPAGCTGVVGLRPRTGTLSLAGVAPLCPSFDTVGPLARSVQLVAAAWTALAKGAAGTGFRSGGAPLDPPRSSARTSQEAPRIAVYDPERTLDAQIGPALAVMGAATPRESGVDEPWIDRILDLLWPAFRAEAAATHADRFRARPDQYGESVARKLRAAASATAGDRAASLAQLAAARTQVLAQWDAEGIDALVLPTLGCPVPWADADEEEIEDPLGRYTAIWSALDLPALAIGRVQLVARTEGEVLALGGALEAAGLRPIPNL
ncbi:amidase [Leucobacter luti]|uniref:amidase n=1 Tax=Leucobacter luti TaxID=340320 RepID=UPI003D015B83